MTAKDNINKRILRQCKKYPDSPISKIIEPFLKLKSRSVLYERVLLLESLGKIEITRTEHKRNLSCKITPIGLAEIEGREEPVSTGAGSL